MEKLIIGAFKMIMRYFTVKEANAILPQIKVLVKKL
jgi:hypothetical protein